MASLTVMTWNVQNLFRPTADADQAGYEAKLAHLSAVIDVVAPDVLALQEVGSEQVLTDLSDVCTIDFDHRTAGIPDGVLRHRRPYDEQIAWQHWLPNNHLTAAA